MSAVETVTYRASAASGPARVDADPITTQVIRHGLIAAAEQMKTALMRTSFSVVIYEAFDFAPVLYDRKIRLLAQAPSQPMFMGTMNFCVEAAVESVGGEENLRPGDIVFTNDPYRTGSHPQDAAFVMPVFFDDTLVGYSAIKAHWLDIGAKAPYCTDTIDTFQEGTIFPGVKLFDQGIRNEELNRVIMSNTRVPAMVEGDINAQVIAVKTGAAGFLRVVERYGLEVFEESIERMFDHGEALMRSYLERIPDGSYDATFQIDGNGVTPGTIDVDITLHVDGSTIRLDYSRAPDQQPGPINSPIPSTVSLARIAMMALAGGGEAPNEGHFRPIELITRPGSIFDPTPPAPCFLYFVPGVAALEAIYRTLAEAHPDAAPAEGAGDLIVMVWWGVHPRTGQVWADGSGHPTGAGGSARGDGQDALMTTAVAGCRFSPIEVWEAKYPWRIDYVELAQDSCGAGKFRGGLGLNMSFSMLEDCYATSAIERTQQPSKGVYGGTGGRPNRFVVYDADGNDVEADPGKNSGLFLAKGSTVKLLTGGGAGYGEPSERAVEAVLRDVRLGYISEECARQDYPHAFRS